MLFARLEKEGKYSVSWTPRRIAFDTETRHMFCTEKDESLKADWKHRICVMRIISKAFVTDMQFRAPDFDSRELFSFRIEGSYRPMGEGILPQYEQPRGDEAEQTIIRPHPSLPEGAKKDNEPDEGKRSTLVWYMRTSNQEDFMKIYTTIRDVLIRDGLCPTLFGGLPKMDPRISVPLAVPPLYLWHRFRTVKSSLFYAFVHGCTVLKNKDQPDSFLISDEPMYLTMFDESIMIFRENGHVFAGIPMVNVESVHYATVDIDESKKDPLNTKRDCFVSVTSRNKKFCDILFLPILEPFVQPSSENVPAAQVNRIKFAFEHLQLFIGNSGIFNESTGNPSFNLADAHTLIKGKEDVAKDPSHRLVGLYAQIIASQRVGGLHLPDEPFENEHKSSERSKELIQMLPPPHRLSSIASRLGIHPPKSLSDHPDRGEYMSHEPTISDTAARFHAGSRRESSFVVHF